MIEFKIFKTLFFQKKKKYTRSAKFGSNLLNLNGISRLMAYLKDNSGNSGNICSSHLDTGNFIYHLVL